MNAYIDGELDLAAGLELERHRQGCQACAQAYRRQVALHAALAGSVGTLASDADRNQADVATLSHEAGQNGNLARHSPLAGRDARAAEESAQPTGPSGGAAGTAALYYFAPAG